jgi:hypothetical protein
MPQEFEIACTLAIWADYSGPVLSVEETVNEDGMGDGSAWTFCT